MRKRALVKWSKRDNDYKCFFDNNGGAVIGHAFFDMIRKYEEFMRKDWEGKPTGFTTFKDFVKDCGYDITTLRFSINSLKH